MSTDQGAINGYFHSLFASPILSACLGPAASLNYCPVFGVHFRRWAR
jgi:hypothetical protein